LEELGKSNWNINLSNTQVINSIFSSYSDISNKLEDEQASLTPDTPVCTTVHAKTQNQYAAETASTQDSLVLENLHLLDPDILARENILALFLHDTTHPLVVIIEKSFNGLPAFIIQLFAFLNVIFVASCKKVQKVPLIILLLLLLLHVQALTDCQILNSGISAITSGDCCVQSGITCVSGRITRM